MNKALLIIDYIESCCLEQYRDSRLNRGLSKVRNMSSSLGKLIKFHRQYKIGEIVWIACVPWVKGHVHRNIQRFYEENPEAEFYSNTIGGNNFYLVQPERHEQIFIKNLYSAFSGTQGKLEAYLRNKEVDHLIVSGIYSTGCVNATICEAFHRDFHITIIRDCVETFDDDAAQEFQGGLINDWSYMYGAVVKLADYMRTAL